MLKNVYLVFTRKDRCRYSRKRAKVCRDFDNLAMFYATEPKHQPHSRRGRREGTRARRRRGGRGGGPPRPERGGQGMGDKQK